MVCTVMRTSPVAMVLQYSCLAVTKKHCNCCHAQALLQEKKYPSPCPLSWFSLAYLANNHKHSDSLTTDMAKSLP